MLHTACFTMDGAKGRQADIRSVRKRPLGKGEIHLAFEPGKVRKIHHCSICAMACGSDIASNACAGSERNLVRV